MNTIAHGGDDAADVVDVGCVGARHMGNVARLAALGLCNRILIVEILKARIAVANMADLSEVGYMGW
jgi:3-deoxy-D-arabino-heptulosonate 7-phosphate (DAHP) synthase|tara:strand:+ start:1483 stop:1683 length:201 start_codon:yes stop_codon:yes gene_type:complete